MCQDVLSDGSSGKQKIYFLFLSNYLWGEIFKNISNLLQTNIFVN